MIKAHSLLYAIYICLLVSIICGALLYFSNLYTLLNLHYNLQEELYLQNQSAVNFALGNKLQEEEIMVDENSGIVNGYTSKPFGLLSALITKSYLRNDTVVSVHIVGAFSKNKTAIYLSNFTKSLSYSGKVKIIGDCYLPTTSIETSYITNQLNTISIQGKKNISELTLPGINPEFRKVFKEIPLPKVLLANLEKTKDSIYFNSFLNETKQIEVNSSLRNIVIKGNFVLQNKDSIRIEKDAVLEDVILIAPKITFAEGFTGNIQAFATKRIELGQKVRLNYPSVVCLYNESAEESVIKIKKESKINGAVVLFGNTLENISKNAIEIDESGLVFGDIYCTGKLDIKSNIYGSIYTNRFFHKTASSTYDNLIENIEINTTKKPSFYIAIPLFEPKNNKYGIIKKVL